MEDLDFSNHDGYGVRSPTMRDLLAIAFRHGRLLVLSFLGMLSGAILVAVLQPNRYEAGMKILVKPGRVDPVATPGAALPQFAAAVTEEELNSEVELLKSKDLLAKVVRTCDLQNRGDSAWSRVLAAIRKHTARQASEEDPQFATAVRILQKELDIEAVKKTNLIAVNYESTDPELAGRVLNALANFYMEKNVAVHRQPEAFGFFQQQTQQYRKRLADAEAHLVDFTHGASVVSAQLEKEVALQKLAEFDNTLKQTKVAIAEAQQRVRTLQEQAGSMPTRMITQVRNADDALILSQLRSNLLTLELKRTELLEKFEPGYRAVQEVDVQIGQTRTELAAAEKSQLHDETTDRDPAYEWVREELSRAKSELAGLQARAEATALTVRSYRENAQSLEQKQIVQDDLIRTVKATEESYLLYLRKEEEARISDALDSRHIINVAIAEAATVPSLPSNHRALTVLVGLLLATFTSVGLAFGSEHLDPTFRTPDEVRSFLNIPVLATMPQNGKNGAAAHVS
jgi:uncharacterized protein involved in exopolysaccharide biosynthesis